LGQTVHGLLEVFRPFDFQRVLPCLGRSQGYGREMTIWLMQIKGHGSCDETSRHSAFTGQPDDFPAITCAQPKPVYLG
ncbi:MAG: hypothetical protein AAAB16_06665, partial [Pseudomonas sp.]|uniref:hypothetical protein n=1 Tax=Pseudomonas sp. TaxID=306 RepID=UPI0030F24DB5